MASMKPRKSSLPPAKAKPREAVTVGPPRRLIGGRVVIAAVVGIAVVVGIVVALVAGGGGDDDDAADPGSGGSVPAASTMFRPVAVEGEPLAPFTRERITGDEPDPAIGELAPVVSGEDYAGNPVTIDAAADGPTMVVLLAHWCPHCNEEIPRLNEWRESGDVPDDLHIVGVSTGVDPNRANYPPDRWLEQKDWEWGVLADSDLSQDTDPEQPTSAFRAYGGEFFPTVIIIGSDGRVLLRFSGEPSADEIADLVSGALENDPGASD
jgi:thiol-disulfide isomerase/thioredoxin